MPRQMYTTRFTMSINILYIFIFNLRLIFCEKLSIDDLKNIVSKKDSKGWLDSLNMTNSSNSYCHLCCIDIGSQTIGKHCGSHTLCKYPTNRTGPVCKGYIQIEFSGLEKEALLDAHNTLRNVVASGLESKGKPGPQPNAANMRVMEWNDELSLIAERWAAQCIYSHDICRDLERFPVGQNMAHGNLATNNELSFVKAWYDEVAYFNKSEVESFKHPIRGKHISGRYTQLVWADTYQIGCARAVFQRSKGSQVSYREHFICNYGPTGNIPHQPVYVVGTPCTACHEGTSCTLDYPALCGGEVINKIPGEEVNDEINNSRALKILTIRKSRSGCSSTCELIGFLVVLPTFIRFVQIFDNLLY